ncbi:hypothetical protein Gotri_014327 [Gossypium trilobum]|uniref:Uncharacterized protein n=1 Tax=Gossypium trilobum TaxID=34281 RepID=A0A7J9DWE8_9ROSI|nr:hypothetical protein [Gossypium trilobum]
MVVLHTQEKKAIQHEKEILLEKWWFTVTARANEQQVSTEIVRISSVEELKNTTKNYDESHIIGKGGFDTVNKDDKVVKERDIEQIKEVYELAKRCLRVKGCCEMETNFGEQCGGKSKSDRQSKYVRQSKSGGQANVTESLSVRQNGRQSNQLP